MAEDFITAEKRGAREKSSKKAEVTTTAVVQSEVLTKKQEWAKTAVRAWGCTR